MYLRHLHVQNVKLLRDVKIDFVDKDGQPRMWTVFVGENRSCKTTLLQTIAAAASGRDQAIHLTTDVVSSWPDLRRPDARLTIDAEFGFDDRGRSRAYPWWLSSKPPRLKAHLHLEPGRSIFDGSAGFIDDQEPRDPLIAARQENYGNWFVAGYGVRRMLHGVGTAERRRPKNPSLDRLKPLFGEDVIGTGFVELLDNQLGRSFAKILESIFVVGGLLPHVTGVELRGRMRSTQDFIEAQRFEMDISDDLGERIRVPAAWLSQGYQSTIAWLADVVGQIILEAGLPVEAADMEGCVLVDEIDMYLHPTWQVRLIPALKQVFPKLQFIVTTHSPMILPALTADEVWLLSHDAEGSVVAARADRSPALLTGTELLETFFEIHKLYPSDLGEKASQYGRLATDPTRTPEEDTRMRSLRRELAAAGIEFDWEPVPRAVTE
jgi:AAA domain, putative AbiEii toxin, Type IV TA system